MVDDGIKTEAANTLPFLHIEPAHGWLTLPLRELWEYRELLYFLTWRDIKIRYKQTLLGVSWAILQPLLTMVVFNVFFNNFANVPTDNIPYPIFAYTALVPWTFFANGLAQASNSLVGNANLIKKVYFPRIMVPISGILTGLPDFALSFVVLLGMMLFYGYHPSLTSFFWLVFFLFLALITSLGIGLWLSALNVEYRDIRYIVPFLVQLWMFATPVAYSASKLTEPLRTLYGLNPMVGVVEGFRWVLLDRGDAPGAMVAVSVLVAVVLLVSGTLYFSRMEESFADVV